MRRVSRTFIAGSIAIFLFLSSAIALSPIRAFDDAGFSDIPNDWSRPYISTCYELGLLSGRGKGIFDPAGTLSVSEAIMAAARVHSLWNGGSGEFPAGETWFSSAVSYATANGIIIAGEFPDYSSTATRTQLAVLLSRVLPQSDYFPINSVISLPDVASDSLYYNNILTLYKAGILTGTDASGIFSPDSPITRAELSAILCRLVQPETRQTFTLQPAEGSSLALQLDEPNFDAMIHSDSQAAILFSADWCQTCQDFSPTFAQFAFQCGEDIAVGLINVDQHKELSDSYDITTIPTVIFFQDGQELDRIVGNNPLDVYVDFAVRNN